MARAMNHELGQLAVLHLLRRRPLLDKQYTVWGKVIEGMENVDKIKRRRAGA